MSPNGSARTGTTPPMSNRAKAVTFLITFALVFFVLRSCGEDIPETPSDVSGLQLDEARAVLEAEGWTVSEHDSAGERGIWDRTNWVVTDQSVTGTEVSLGAKKKDDDSRAAEQAAQEAADLVKAQEVEAYLKMSFGGVEDFIDLFAEDPSYWAGYIVNIRVEHSNVFVTLQVAPGDPLGSRAAQAMSTLFNSEIAEGLNFVVVEDGAGGFIDQKMITPIN